MYIILLTYTFITPIKFHNSMSTPLLHNTHNNILMKNNFISIPSTSDRSEEYIALCYNNSCKQIIKQSDFESIKLVLYILLWFGLSAKYNICNKLRLNMLNLPWSQCVISLGAGSTIPLLFWRAGIRKPPVLNKHTIVPYIPISIFHALGHITAVVSVGAGAVSFTQIIKAAEPVFTCGFNWLFLGSIISFPTFLSLIPIIFGVSFASVSELYFTWSAFNGAMISNAACAARNVFSRKSLDKPSGENITPENLLGILTIMSFIISIPLAVIFERNQMIPIWNSRSISTYKIFKTSFETGLYFYLYNEAAMIVLNKINPVTHAIVNTLKRIIILITCVIFFKTPLTQNGLIGSSIAIIGSYLYSKTKKIKAS